MTINPKTNPKTFCFNQNVIVIGDGAPESVDICFPAEGLHQNHIKIIFSDGTYVVINQAGDPFITLNGHPFTKKVLEQGDDLQIRDHIMHIDEIRMGGSPQAANTESTDSQDLKEEDIPFPDIASLAHDENPEAWFPSELEYSKKTAQEAPSDPIEESYNLDEPSRASHSNLTPSPSPHSFRKKMVKFIALFSILAIILTSLVFTELYFRASNKSVQEEILAAESIADYAMALTFAKTFQSASQKNNWLDPHFIKNNLADLLSAHSLPCGQIDAQGQFSSSPYLLRFYMNRDFSRFLLIAQPSPILSHMILPQKALIIDSHLMDVRKTDDLKTINRLLSNEDPLDGISGDEITKTLYQAEIIPLELIATGTEKKEFSPPKALAYIRPGAENHIYNAPRYHQFGGTLLGRIMMAVKNNDSSVDLQNEINAISELPDLVIYNPKGIRKALQGEPTLRKLVPQGHFFTAYLLYSDQGEIVNSHLFFDNNTITSPSDPPEKVIAEEYNSKISEQEILGDELSIAKILKDKGEYAQEEIGSVLHSLFALLETTLEKDGLYLQPVFFQLLELYKEKQSTVQVDLQNAVDQIRTKFPEIDDAMIERLLREYGLLDVYKSRAP